MVPSEIQVFLFFTQGDDEAIGDQPSAAVDIARTFWVDGSKEKISFLKQDFDLQCRADFRHPRQLRLNHLQLVPPHGVTARDGGLLGLEQTASFSVGKT